LQTGPLNNVTAFLRDIACDTLTVPGYAYNFSSNLVDYLTFKKTNVPTSVANTMFNSIRKIGGQFASLTAQFQGKINDPSNPYLPCQYTYWVNEVLSLSFGIGLAVHVFPPNEFSLSASLSCSSLDCWACVTGLSPIVSLLETNLKRSTDLDSNYSQTNDSFNIMTDNYNSTENSQCTQYYCNGGAFNDRVCGCICTSASDIYTPQYGCYNAQSYQNGNAPTGANPNANPNNANYDPTVDPYSPLYVSDKDTSPYYNPYWVSAPETASGTYIVVYFLVLVLAVLLN